MATSLFGPSPLDYQQAQQAGLQQQASQYAQLNPLQRAAQGMYQAGSNLGGGVAGLMGIQDPMAEKASKIESILQGSDQTSAQGFMDLYKKFSDANLPQQAQLAAAKAQELKKAESSLSLEAARAEYLKGGGAKGTGASGGLGKIRPEAYTPDSLEAFNTSVQEGTPDYSLLIPKDPIAKQQALSSAGKQALAEGLVPGTEEFKQRAKEIYSAQENKVAPATLSKLADNASTIVSLQQSGAKLDKLIPTIQQMDLGMVSNFFRTGAATLGINTEDRTKFDALKRTVIGEANKLLLLAKGTQTEGDAVRARDQIVSDATWKNADALTAALNDLKDSHASTVKEIEAKQQVLTSGGRPAPVAASKAPANVDWAAAFAKQQALNPAWKNFTLEQFKQKAGAK